MKINTIITIILSAAFLFSCQETKDALQGKKRSESSDEFLVEKKNPLTTPPDYNELPVPLSQERKSNEESDSDIKKILEINNNEETNTQNDSNSNTSLKKSILEKITD
jgi:hypothetical protein|tara:strand:- start:252 stop:575 length:324 start_codon:yes stop_codon:yes gene_type:complete